VNTLDRAILDCRLALRDDMTPERRERLEAELQDLRLARLGVSSRRMRSRLRQVGAGGRPRIIRRTFPLTGWRIT
jgi:hypothetical protein